VKRRQALFAGIAAMLLSARGVRAQVGAKVPTVAFLDASERSDWWLAFQQQLRDLGYVEGRNVNFETRSAKGNLDTLPALAQELVRQKVAVIVTSGTSAALAAKRATSTIPIVMATGTDQVSLGLAASLAHPGRNVTGLSTLTSELMGKRFEVMRELNPAIARLAVLWHRDNLSSMTSVRDLETVAGKSKVTLQTVGVGGADELADAFAAMTRERAQAVIVVQTPVMYIERARIAELAIKHRLPSMFGAAEYVEAGGLMSYAPPYTDLFRRAAVYVDKILKGANPGDLPIEQPTTFELVVNAKTARAIGVTIPTSILTHATRVVQ